MAMKNRPIRGFRCGTMAWSLLGAECYGSGQALEGQPQAALRHRELQRGHLARDGHPARQAFGGGAEKWLRLQVSYDLAQTMKRADEIKVERLSPVA